MFCPHTAQQQIYNHLHGHVVQGNSDDHLEQLFPMSHAAPSHCLPCEVVLADFDPQLAAIATSSNAASSPGVIPHGAWPALLLQKTHMHMENTGKGAFDRYVGCIKPDG